MLHWVRQPDSAVVIDASPVLPPGPTLAHHILRKGSRLRRRAMAFHLRAAGFTGRAARSWLRIVERDRRRDSGVTAAERTRAYEWGFTPDVVANFGIAAHNRIEFISMRDYLFAQPFNGKYNKWIRDRVSASMVFEPFRGVFDTVHYQLFHRDGGLRVSSISDDARRAGTAIPDLAAFIAERGELVLAPSSWAHGVSHTIRCENGRFVVDGLEYETDDFRTALTATVSGRSHVLIEPLVASPPMGSGGLRVNVTMMNPSGARPTVAEARVIFPEDREPGGPLRYVAQVNRETGRFENARARVDGVLRTFYRRPGTGEAFAGVVPEWPGVVRTLTHMCAFAPQLRFVEFALEVDARGLRVTRISATPRYSFEFPFSPDTAAFLRELVDEKHASARRLPTRVGKGLHNTKLKIRREFARAVYPRGLVPYQSVRWLGDVRRDFFQPNGVPVATKLWAYRHGFLSYRIPQYGIVESNRHRYISDFEYRWLRHINDRYKYWLEDKVSIKYLAAGFNEFLPAYYFYTSRSGGQNHVVPMMDCPDGYGADYDDVLRLAREKGVLALKPDEGSHGEGFYRLAWEADGGFSLNGEAVSETTVVALLANPKNRYLITEFIEMHPMLAEIYPHSVNTIRMIVFKKNGAGPRLGNAYLRIGSLASGYVDNTAAGGMLAEIDLETGRFGNAKRLVRGRVEESPRHPDTGVPIAGTIPNWTYVKEQVLTMAASFAQLEYLGFDVAVTPRGFKVPEINRFPDFPRIDRLTRETTDYLLFKLEQKKRRFGYDVRRPIRLISLPKRDGR